MRIFTRLFGCTSARQQSVFMQAQERVLDYARFLEREAPMPGRVLDESRLPHPKAQLKAALLTCISNTSDERIADHLRAGYMMLPAFQPGVGEPALGTDYSSLDLEQDPLTVAGQIERESETAARWGPRLDAEIRAAQQELYSLELAIPARNTA